MYAYTYIPVCIYGHTHWCVCICDIHAEDRKLPGICAHLRMSVVVYIRRSVVVYVRIYVCTSVYKPTYTLICLQLGHRCRGQEAPRDLKSYMCISGCTYIRTYQCVYTYIQNGKSASAPSTPRAGRYPRSAIMYVYQLQYMYVYTYIPVGIYVYTHWCVCICAIHATGRKLPGICGHIRVSVVVYVRIYVHTSVYIHTRMSAAGRSTPRAGSSQGSAIKPPRVFGVQSLGFRVRGLGLRDKGLGFRVESFGFRVSGSGFRVEG